MYNRYSPNGASYTRIPEEDAPPVRTPPEPEQAPEAEKGRSTKPPAACPGCSRGSSWRGWTPATCSCC